MLSLPTVSEGFAQHHFSTKSGAGFTLIEFLIAFAVVAILFALAQSAFLQFIRTGALDREARTVVSIVEDARVRTIFSEGDTQYGVHFSTDEVVLFEGTTYSESDPDNEIQRLRRVTITDISLVGGGNDVVFDRISGATAAFGTTTISLDADAAQTRHVRILQSGLVELVQ